MHSTYFSLDVATVVFGGSASPERALLEGAATVRFKKWLDQESVTDDMIRAKCLVIDKELISRFSGPGRLVIARMIEERFPEVIEDMPTLKPYLQPLMRAHTLSQVFMPRSISMLVRALVEEGAR